MALRLFGSAALAWLLTALPACAQEGAGAGVLPPPSTSATPPVLVDPALAAKNPYSVLPAPAEVNALEEPVEAGVLDPIKVTPTPVWYQPTYWFDFDPWDAGVELGINGSQGNNDTFSMRTGGHLKRETPRWKFDSSLNYNKNHSNGVETQNNAKLDSRLDRTIKESPWTLFVLENLIYDEFQSWDLQMSLNSGVGYRWVKTPTLDFLTRIGGGATREFGGVENDWQPTALMGVDYTHQLTAMQSLTAKVDYFPEWEDFRNYRVVSDIGWKIDLDQPKNVSLKFSLIDRYDSTPDGAVPNNLDYAVLLIWAL